MEPLRIPVITSNRAEKDFANIVTRHNDIIAGMTTQAQKVREMNERNAMIASDQNAKSMEDANRQKELQLKEQEIAIRSLD